MEAQFSRLFKPRRVSQSGVPALGLGGKSTGFQRPILSPNPWISLCCPAMRNPPIIYRRSYPEAAKDERLGGSAAMASRITRGSQSGRRAIKGGPSTRHGRDPCQVIHLAKLSFECNCFLPLQCNCDTRSSFIPSKTHYGRLRFVVAFVGALNRR